MGINAVILIWILILILLDFLFVAFFRRLKKGHYKVHADTSEAFEFSTDVGGYAIDRAERVFRYTTPETRGTIPLDDVQKLEFGLVEKYPFLKEWFFGFNLTDMMRRYQDSDYWYSITILTAEGKHIPVYLGGQYKQREFLLTWYINLQQRLLEMLGAFVDVHDWSRAVVDSIQDAFEESGVTLKVGAMSSRPEPGK